MLPDCARENHPLAPHTYYRVGGPARIALFPSGYDEFMSAYQWMTAQAERTLILGRGSNVLIADEGFPGIVLFTTGLNNIESAGDGRYNVEAGVNLDRLVREVMLPGNYGGVGALTGIPGSVGGAIYMNAGTVNGSTCEMLARVTVLGGSGVRETDILPGLYAYRSQTFCGAGEIILRGVFQFHPAETSQREVYDHYMLRRKEKQPQGHCCGSVFKNPEGGHAGQLIEACGLKGTRHGGAVISPLHANFIMNEDQATANDILALIQLCKKSVHDRFGLELHEEVRIIR
jgi:UDP-N-acetylmuramate dehydrogenase